MSDRGSALLSRLLQLQSHFTWNLKKENVDLENLSTRLENHIRLQLGQRGAMAVTYNMLAYVRFLQGQSEEALNLLYKSEETIKKDFGAESELRLLVVYGDLAWLKYKTGDVTQSEESCQRVERILLKYPTTSSSLLHAEVYGEKGWSYLKFEKSYYPKAIECFDKALEQQPDDAEWNTGCAIAMYREDPRVSESFSKAEESPVVKQLRRALEISPNDGVLLSLLALKLTAYKKHKEAEVLVEKALRVDPNNPHTIRYIGKHFRNQGDVDQSINLLQRALTTSSDSAFIHHQLALCYKQKKISEQMEKPYNNQKVKNWRRLSIHHLEEAVEIRTTFTLAIVDLALMYGEEKDFSRAEELFQQVSDDKSQMEKSIRQLFHVRYADFYLYHAKQEPEAIKHYIEGLQLIPGTWEAKQCVKKLKMIADRRLSKDAKDHEALGLRGLLAKVKGETKEAMEFYEKALDCDRDNDDYLSVLMELRMNL